MKMTKKKAQAQLKAIKSGLSMVLAIVLMGNITQPLRVLAASPTDSTQTTEAVSGAAAEAPEAQSTVQEVLLQVCQENEAIPAEKAEKCAKDLFGILMQESRGKANAVGDRGLARGWFQINRYYNPAVTVACAEDLRCSADWTLNNLVENQYLKYANWAIWCHNGCGISKTYVPAVRYKTQKFWSVPLVVTTAEQQRALIALK